MAIKPYPQYVNTQKRAKIDAVYALNRGDTCVIQRKGSSQDAGGAPTSGGYSDVATVDCQVKSADRVAVERIFGGEVGPEVNYVVKMPRDADVRSDDQVAVNGTTLQVVGTNEYASYGFELLVATKATE